MKPSLLNEALRRLHIVLIVAMAGLFLRCGEPQGGSQLSVDGGTAITADEDWPDFFVRYYFNKTNGGDESGRCSGTHVGYGVILTAAHCVMSTSEDGDVSENRLTSIQYKFFDGSQYKMHRHRFASDGDYTIRAHSNYEILPIEGKYKGTFLFDDIALIMTKLDQHPEHPIRGHAYLPTPAYITESQIGGLVTIYGDGHPRNRQDRHYGKVVLDAQKYAGIYPNNQALNEIIGALRHLKIGNMSVDEWVIRTQISERLWQRKLQGERSSTVPTKLSFDASGNTQPGYLRGICKGDSGGGSIKLWNNQSLVVGVTSASAMDIQCLRWHTKDCCAAGELAHVRAYLAWIGSEFKNQGLEWPPHGDDWDEFSVVTDADENEDAESSPKKARTFAGCSWGG